MESQAAVSGGRPTGLPSGLVTFLFTDIQGSTRLYQRLGDAYPEVLAVHDRVLHDVFTEAGGYVVTHLGDGLFVAFASASDAAAAAVRAQQVLAQQTWPHNADVSVRMGMHSGRAAASGGNYVALAVHQAARVSATAHGGQVILSQAAVDALTDRTDLVLTPLGQYRLKDFDTAESLWQLDAPGPVRRFPAPRVPPVTGHNLRIGRTSFVGRDAEIREIQERLAGHSLVSVLGPGGAGKSRTATRVAAESVDLYPDGVRAVGLVATVGEDDVLIAVADALGVSDGHHGLREAVLTWLEPRQMLLLLDNCEHVAAAVSSVVVDVLERAPQVRVLVTSRQPLGVPGEVRWRLKPLDVPPPDAPEASLLDYDSVMLFCQRAAAADQNFDPSAHLSQVGTLCRLVDGLPLAIELAAARSAVYPLSSLTDALTAGEELGGIGQHGDTPHHQSLSSLIAWSVDALSRSERTALSTLAVFPAGFDLRAARHVLGSRLHLPTPFRADEIVANLVDKSLIQRADDRYVILETIRQYCARRLSDASLRACRDSMLDWAIAATAVATSDEPAYLEVVAAEHDNLIDTLRYASNHVDPERCLALVRNLGRHFARGHYDEGLQAWTHLAEKAPGTPIAAQCQVRAGALTYRLGRHDEAAGLLRSAIEQLRALGDVATLVEALSTLAAVLTQAEPPDHATAQDLLAEASERAEGIGDRAMQARVEGNLGLLAQERGELEISLTHQRRALELDPENAVAWYNLGEVAEELGRLEEAIAHFRDSLRLANEDWYVTFYAALALGRLLKDRDAAEALRCGEQALRAAESLGDEAAIEQARGLLGDLS